jgi:tetratricopeptide (TPR) repeat protein
MKTINSIFLILLLSQAFIGYGQTAEEYYKGGLAKEESRDNNVAIIYYSKAIELNPKYAEAYSGRAFCKGELKDHRGAIADYTKAIEMAPKYPFDYKDVYMGRGYAKYNLKDYRGAISDYSKAIEIDVKYAIAYYIRGLAKLKIGQKESGCLDLSKAGELGEADAYEAISKYCQ